MTCRDYQHQISLFLYEELPEPDRPALEAHLQECESCRRILEEEKSLHMVLAEDVASWDIPSDLLVDSRRALADQLDRVEKKRSWWRIPAFSAVFSPMRLLESAALVAMGLALGVYVTNQQIAIQNAHQGASVAQESPVNAAIPANGSVSNLRILNADPSTGEVELAGEVVQPLRFHGKVDDDNVLQLLFSAMRDSSNPGSRLRAVEVLSHGANEQSVKAALIQALMYDDNPGVRLKAIQGLKPYAADEDVRTAFKQSLRNDDDAGIRVEAIDALTHNPKDRELISKDKELTKELEQLAKDENNTYIRMKYLQLVGNNQ